MQRLHHGQADLIFPAPDGIRYPAADVQRGGYHRCGEIYRKRRPGGGGFHYGADQHFHQPVHRRVPGGKCAGGPVLCGGPGPGDVGGGTYGHYPGADQRRGHGICRSGAVQSGPGNHGDAGKCDRPGGPLHADLFPGDAFFHAI